MKKLFSIFIFLFFLLSTSNSDGHKFFTSITQIEYNDKSHSYEIIMNVFLDDWEKALGSNLKRQINSDKENIESISFQYLQKHFIIQHQGRAMNYKMIGMKFEKDICKIFLELPQKFHYTGLQIKNDCLIEEFDGQVNLVNCIHEEVIKTIIFKSKSQFQELNWN